MNPLRLDDEAIFHAARKIEAPEAQAAYLAQVCGEDDGLRREVEILLSAYDRERSFLESPPTEFDHRATAAWSAPIESPDTVIGPYKLLEAIGEGGMGTVYMAEQTAPVRRRVALKVIKPGMDSRQVVARFEAERQALAMMDHPNIARVFDGGMTPSGRPYFVMELVRGLPITEYCDREQRTIAERLELFVLVCRAVQHAHQKGVIHRDIKPSNVLVTVIDGAAVPKVIDFGVAKATGPALTDRTLFTGFHQFVGTPLYMSPEQADLSAGDVDTRSDIYALGVLLYELLTGTTPFDRDTFQKAAFDEMRRIIREQEPPRPSTRLSSLGATRTTTSAHRKADDRRLGRTLRGELDWVVMKALEKDRRRRYETANDFASDVMRYLTDEPVEACPPTTRYRLAKYARRNRAALTTALLVGVVLLAGMAVSTWQAVRATAAEHRAKDERDEAVVQRQRAEARFRLAFQSIHKLRAISPNLRSVAGTERTETMRRAVKEDLLRFYRQIVDDNEDDPRFTYEVAESCFFLADLEFDADHERADRLLRKSVALYERVAREGPDDSSVLGALANTLLFLGRFSYRYRNEIPQAEASFRRSLETFERVARMHPERVDDWFLMCNLGAWGYGSLLRRQGRDAEARELDRRILAWFERPGFDLNWFERRPGPSAMIRDDGYSGFMALGELLTRCGQPLRAIPILERARPQLIFDKDYQYYSDALSPLCRELVKDSDPVVRERAVALARDNVEVMSGTSPEAWLTLGLILAQTGDVQGSDDAFRRLSQLSGASAGTLNEIAWPLVSDPQYSAVRPGNAVLVAERAIKQLTFGDRQAATTWNTLGVAYYRAGDWKAAIEALERSEALAPDKLVAFNGFFLAMAHWRRGEKEQARRWYEKAVAGMNADDDELRRFRAEAAALLGMQPPGEVVKPRSSPESTGPPK